MCKDWSHPFVSTLSTKIFKGEHVWCAAKSKHAQLMLLEDDSAVFSKGPSAKFANVKNLKCPETET
jgi:hypothetical protein